MMFRYFSLAILVFLTLGMINSAPVEHHQPSGTPFKDDQPVGAPIKPIGDVLVSQQGPVMPPNAEKPSRKDGKGSS
jgi:hypothetical protein